MVSIVELCQSEISLHALCSTESLNGGVASDVLNWLSREVHHDFNATIPRILALQPDFQARMALYVGWLRAEGKAARLEADIENLVRRVSTARQLWPDAACPMMAAIWRALEEDLCLDPRHGVISRRACEDDKALEDNARLLGETLLMQNILSVDLLGCFHMFFMQHVNHSVNHFPHVLVVLWCHVRLCFALSIDMIFCWSVGG
jgi:hypothetical protein